MCMDTPAESDLVIVYNQMESSLTRELTEDKKVLQRVRKELFTV